MRCTRLVPGVAAYPAALFPAGTVSEHTTRCWHATSPRYQGAWPRGASTAFRLVAGFQCFSRKWCFSRTLYKAAPYTCALAWPSSYLPRSFRIASQGTTGQRRGAIFLLARTGHSCTRGIFFPLAIVKSNSLSRDLRVIVDRIVL
eukprot:275679-Rhodomonas_salina.1